MLQGNGKLVYIDLSGRSDQVSARVGGTALAQVFGQVGDLAPDIDNPHHLRVGFKLIQDLIRERQCTAGHDISDGGLVTTLLELAFATNCGLKVDLSTSAADADAIQFLFAEECGVVLEIKRSSMADVQQRLTQAQLRHQIIGDTICDDDVIVVRVNQETVLQV